MADQRTSTAGARFLRAAGSLLLVVACVALANVAHAKMYKWVDAAGKLSVGTSPPPKDYQWVDERGVYYNVPVVNGRELIYIGTAPDKKVETHGSLRRSRGFGAGSKAAWDASLLRSAEPVQVGLGDQFLPIEGADRVVIGVTGNVIKEKDCLAVDLDNRGDGTLTDLRAAFALYTSNVYIGQRVVTVAELPKGTKSVQVCEGQGKVSFADGIALDHMTWKAGGVQKNWPSDTH
ncbi:MAG: DUF4124 domain-containing protein [bacterium]